MPYLHVKIRIPDGTEISGVVNGISDVEVSDLLKIRDTMQNRLGSNSLSCVTLYTDTDDIEKNQVSLGSEVIRRSVFWFNIIA